MGKDLKDVKIFFYYTYNIWQNDMNEYRKKLYFDFVDPNGWYNMSLLHNNTLEKLKITAYKSYKFYNNVLFDLIISHIIMGKVETIFLCCIFRI